MKYHYLLLPFLILILGACASISLGGAQQAGVYDQHDGRSLEEVSVDAEITERVQTALVNYPFIDVSTYDGVVTLNGKAGSQSEENYIIRKVENVSGVQRVESSIEVK